MQSRTIVDISVDDVDKRRQPSKHYVYVIKVDWSDGTSNVIYRRYSKFFDLQCSLLERFPIEGGKKDPDDRIIPFLPGKILFGRSHIREVALKRLTHIDKYCKELIGLSSNISQCKEVLNFFESREEDFLPQEREEKFDKPIERHHISEPVSSEQYVAIANRLAEESNETSLEAGENIEVVEKHANGWWFVTSDAGSGWVPRTFLESKDGNEQHERITDSDTNQPFTCLADYTPQYQDELKVEKDAVVTVVEKRLDGWWLVRYNGSEGIIPASYLTKSETTAPTNNTSRHNLSPPNSHVGKDNGTKPVPFNIFKSPMAKRKLPPPRRQSVKTPECAPPQPVEELIYMTVNVFKGNVEGGLSFTTDKKVEVLEKHNTGWWFVDIDGVQGWAPSSYIEKKAPQATGSSKISRAAPAENSTSATRTPAGTPTVNMATELQKHLAGHKVTGATAASKNQAVWESCSSAAFVENSSDDEDNVYSNIDDSDSGTVSQNNAEGFNKWAPSNPKATNSDLPPKTILPPPSSPLSSKASSTQKFANHAPPPPPPAKISPKVHQKSPSIPSHNNVSAIPQGRAQFPIPHSKPKPQLPKTPPQASKPHMASQLNSSPSPSIPTPPSQAAKPSNKENHPGPILPTQKPRPNFQTPTEPSDKPAIPQFSGMGANFGLRPVTPGGKKPTIIPSSKPNMPPKEKFNATKTIPKPPPVQDKPNLPAGGVKSIRGMFEN